VGFFFVTTQVQKGEDGEMGENKKYRIQN